METNTSDTKRRAPNFTTEETQHLCQLANKYKHLIENRKLDFASVKIKRVAWNRITNEYNASTKGLKRTMDSLKLCLKNQKAKTKQNIPVEKPGIQVQDCDSSPEESTMPDWKKNDDRILIAIEDVDIENSDLSETDDSLPRPRRSVLKRKVDPIQIIDDDINTSTSVTKNNIRRSPAKTNCEASFTNMTDDKNGLVEVQKQLILVQIEREQIKLEKEKELKDLELEEAKCKLKHLKLLQEMELKELHEKYSHNKKIRRYEMTQIHND